MAYPPCDWLGRPLLSFLHLAHVAVRLPGRLTAFGNAFQSICGAAHGAWQTTTCATWADPLCALLIAPVPALGARTAPILLTLLLPLHPFGIGMWGLRRCETVAPHAASLSLPLETGTSPCGSCEKLSTLPLFFPHMNPQIGSQTQFL